jgi:hypothetical protein
MARVSATEDAGVDRDEEGVSSAEEQAAPSDEGDAHMRDPSHSTQDNQLGEDSPPNFTCQN